MADRLRRLLDERIVILDGAMGTMLQRHGLTPEDFGGVQREGCNEVLCLTRPDVICAIHAAYLEAGADIIETNTFGATPVVLAEYGLADQAEQINLAAARLAREVADRYGTQAAPRFVAGAMGPTTKTLSLTGGIEFDELVEAYRIQARGLLQGGVDLLLVETAQDMLNVKAASLGIRAAFSDLNTQVPLIVSGTIEAMGTTLAGQTADAFYLAIEHLGPLAVGLNCATGPEFMRDHVRQLSAIARCAVSCYPNAGLPDENGHYHETPHSFATKLADFAAQGWVNLVGGCCGTTPEHIRALREAVAGHAPRALRGDHPHAVSGLEAVYLEADNRPLLVGERTNVIGSRKFRRLIAAGEYEAAAEIARSQVRAGAHVVDICLADPDRDEAADMACFLPHVTRRVKAPLMIDTTDARVAELALRQIQGKAVINSTNLEDGEPRLLRFGELAKKYGAALVVGCIDERGMALTVERKLEVAKRALSLLVERCGLHPQDVIFDALTFPVGTGDAHYLGAAGHTIEGIRQLKARFPECPTILGISNVSFGLPPAGREVLNAVFLYHCTKAGLDYAIVNTEKLQRFAAIPEEERALCERLLFHTTDEAVAEFTEFYRSRRSRPSASATADLPLEQRLARYVVEGSKDGLFEDLAQALQTHTPLEIINGPLMDGMNEVGRLFNNNELIVAEVLQSAEVMKAAVAYLEPYMERTADAGKGTVLLATVKGDVHDIGKNLVEIILSNNGYRVINLGIKVAPELLIKAVREHRPDLIGLSGLLVKSAQQMVVTAEDLRQAGIRIPLLVGGAALTKKFTYTRIAPVYGAPVMYAKDAMEGLEWANRWMDPDKRQNVLEQLEHETRKLSQPPEGCTRADYASASGTMRSNVNRRAPVFVPPDLKRHILRSYPVHLVRPYLNLQMLLGKHLGLRGNVEKRLAEGDPKAHELLRFVDALLDESAASGTLTLHAVYQFFPVKAQGDALCILNPDRPDEVVERFEFPRQPHPPYLCLADFVRPWESEETDYVAMFAVTSGRAVREAAEALKEAGEFLKSHALQALALEMAEAFAERVHQMLRDQWGFPDPPEMTMRDRFIARYQGIRVSFGYPACPNLADQKKLFRLICPEDIGIELTEGFMMDPEASVSALVFSHPEARYFNANGGDGAPVDATG
jgi:5-methyltetrahydrofolate--homocysteine methyltransferase